MMVVEEKGVGLRDLSLALEILGIFRPLEREHKRHLDFVEASSGKQGVAGEYL